MPMQTHNKYSRVQYGWRQDAKSLCTDYSKRVYVMGSSWQSAWALVIDPCCIIMILDHIYPCYIKYLLSGEEGSSNSIFWDQDRCFLTICEVISYTWDISVNCFVTDGEIYSGRLFFFLFNHIPNPVYGKSHSRG